MATGFASGYIVSEYEAAFDAYLEIGLSARFFGESGKVLLRELISITHKVE